MIPRAKDTDTRPQDTVLLALAASSVARRMADYLRARGFRVEQAENSEQALAQLRRHRFNAVLVDAEIPGPLDGFSVLQHVRRQAAASDVALIHGTGHLLRAVARLCERALARRPPLSRSSMLDAKA
ncbi:response regulator [Enhydrobacter sp.]|jgi:DNA-binding NtrC family response regulator|uniref:response regulator n=1 Tax=Enhydrobacter sp. TaxID=1894999 RepID=UPI0026120B83|nr:response regulator [Enhydrobacter sp.]